MWHGHLQHRVMSQSMSAWEVYQTWGHLWHLYWSSAKGKTQPSCVMRQKGPKTSNRSHKPPDLKQIEQTQITLEWNYMTFRVICTQRHTHWYKNTIIHNVTHMNTSEWLVLTHLPHYPDNLWGCYFQTPLQFAASSEDMESDSWGLCMLNVLGANLTYNCSWVLLKITTKWIKVSPWGEGHKELHWYVLRQE